MNRVRREYPALARPAFARYLLGHTISGFGTWFQVIAQSLLILDIAGSGRALGITAALQFTPMLLVTPYAGVLIDRLQARKVLIVTGGSAGILALALWAITASGHVTTGWVWLMAPLLGLCQTFERPAQGALLGELVTAEERPSASALSSVVNSSGRLVGPAMAGLIYEWRGPAICFLLNGLSYLFVVWPLSRISDDEITPRSRRDNLGALGQLKAGLSYVYRSPRLRAPMVWTAVIGLLAFNFFTVIPAFIRFEFGLGGRAIGLAEGVNAGASVLTGLWIARRPRPPTRRYLAITTGAFGLVVFGNFLMPTFGWFLAWMPLFGVSFMYWLTTMTALIQTETEPAYLGRVTSLFSLGVFGTTPIGALITGWLIDHYSTRHAMALGLLGIIPAALWLWLVPARPEAGPESESGFATTPTPASST